MKYTCGKTDIVDFSYSAHLIAAHPEETVQRDPMLLSFLGRTRLSIPGRDILQVANILDQVIQFIK